MNHNHITRDIKAPGKCPACDEYRDNPAPRVAAGPTANQAWHMFALHQHADDITRAMLFYAAVASDSEFAAAVGVL